MSVGQGMKQIYLYLWYPLFQAQCDQQNYQNWLVTGHRQISKERNMKLKETASFFSFFLDKSLHTYKGTSRREEEHSLYP